MSEWRLPPQLQRWATVHFMGERVDSTVKDALLKQHISLLNLTNYCIGVDHLPQHLNHKVYEPCDMFRTEAHVCLGIV